jgi:type II secretory pathway pseudopilin PulG
MIFLERGRILRSKKAISPAISTVVITAAIVVMLLIMIVFANNFLASTLAQDEFSAAQQFMQQIGLQIDAVAWTTDRTQTTRFSSQYGTVEVINSTLNYAFLVDNTQISNFTVSILVFNMPVSSYTVGNNYLERISPTDKNFMHNGTSAPVACTYVVEEMPMYDGNYIRVVVAPSIRMLQSQTNFYNFYLPILQAGPHPWYSQSVTLQCTNTNTLTTTAMSNVTVQVTFPSSNLGFNSTFFGFNPLQQQISVPPSSTIQIITGTVTASLGVYA